jgi:hypothetical protein
MASVDPATRHPRASSAPPRSVTTLRHHKAHPQSLPSKRFANATTSKMSSRTATAYTSAALPNTPPTSSSRRASTACESPILQALDKVQSVTLHIAKPAIFGFQLAIACDVTKRPMWFCGLTHGDRISTLARPSAENEVTLAPSPTKEAPRESLFTQKALIFTIGGYAAHWFARSASQNPSTLITISSALWWVFGGYRVLGQPKQKFELTKKSCTNRKIDAQLDSSSVVVADTPCVTPLVDPVGTVTFQDPEVKPGWTTSTPTPTEALLCPKEART